MGVEFRSKSGVRMTFLAGREEPLWEVAELARTLGSIRRVARRLRWTQSQVREAIWHSQWHPADMQRERQEAMAAGYRRRCPAESPHLLVFPASRLRDAARAEPRRFPSQ